MCLFCGGISTYLPPQTSIDGSSAAQDAASHLVGVGAGDAGTVNPDLVAQTGNVESGQVGALEPLGLHDAAPATRRRGSLLDEEDVETSLAELVCNGNATSAGTNHDVVVGLGRGRLALCLRTVVAAAVGLGRVSGQGSPIAVRGRGSTLKLGSPLTKAGIVEAKGGTVGAVGVLQALLAGSAAEDEEASRGGDFSDGSFLVPRETVLAAVDELELGSSDVGRHLSELGIARVYARKRVACGEPEGRLDLTLVRPGDQEQSLGHLAGLAVRETAPAGRSRIFNFASLRI